MGSVLLLGPVVFDAFEIPSSIAWGGAQRLNIHRLPGGARVIDAMGHDEAPITWRGVFSGPDAAARARLVDLLRADGSVWPLSWDNFLYSVVISSFQAEYDQANWIPYRIACTVLRDEAEVIGQAVLSLSARVIFDVTAAGGGTDMSAVLGALGVAGATTRGSQAYGDATTSLQGAVAQIQGNLDGASAGMAGLPLGTTLGLAQAASVTGRAAGLAMARGYAQRAQVNLSNAGS
ncbi:MAG: hypothetical protein KGJ41_02745 [Rhodospirillales bacterium]|nr:hypothetical protein [Rhodospirillales bacterium]